MHQTVIHQQPSLCNFMVLSNYKLKWKVCYGTLLFCTCSDVRGNTGMEKFHVEVILEIIFTLEIPKLYFILKCFNELPYSAH